VQGKDLYGNLVGTTAVTISGVDTTRTANTVNGVASFGTSLSKTALGAATLHASALSGAVNADSSTFQIKTDLKACDNKNCQSSANTGNGLPTQRVVNFATTGSDFFTSSTNVLLSTDFVPGDTFTSKCTGAGGAIGQGGQAQIQGAGLASTSPTTYMILVLPRTTLKAFNITSRSAISFNACLGATWLGDPTAVTPWTGKDPSTGAPVLASLIDSQYWAVAADCGTVQASASEPCAALKTKQAADVTLFIQTNIDPTWTATQTAGFMKDADLAVVVREVFPWDLKGSLN
jgi:hypothetical protein